MAHIEIDGIKLKTREGAMVIEAADEAGIYIPRFCYHKKLSIAANCRMCLVEVEKVGKPVPACATPVTDGMKVYTKSPKAIAAQKGVMEFLLINHPLDCPICDQGGECELQDISMGYGGDISRFSERKRAVLNKDLGPLIATDMTRCIHCTRCVRFGEEIGGLRELGATGRGEHMEIGTYVKHHVVSELSGNVIDLCPVGALTSKPFRFAARSWELIQRETVAPHDCLGSNLYVHIRNNEVMRVVPRENESINETWISDRDRFSYQALNSSQRLTSPMIKVKGQWQKVDWNTALQYCVEGMKKVVNVKGVDQVGALISPTATVEEQYLSQKLMRAIGSNNIDHRIRQQDFSDQQAAPVFPWLGQSIADLENNDAVLLIGSDIRRDQPIAAHRLRKAAHRGLRLSCVNSVDYDFYMPVAQKIIVQPAMIASQLAGIAKALSDLSGADLPAEFKGLLATVTSTEEQRAIAESLNNGKISSVLIGPQAMNHVEASAVNTLARLIAGLSSSRYGYLFDSGNAVGAVLAGALPHRGAAGAGVSREGLHAGDMILRGMSAYLLLDVEPEIDSLAPVAAANSLSNAEFVVCLSVFDSDSQREYADVMLPVAPFTETSGTYVNAAGQWQSFAGAVAPRGEARPAWKVLRVLGNLFNCAGFEYVTSGDVLSEMRESARDIQPDNEMELLCPAQINTASQGLVRITEMQMYAGDTLQRRATALHETPDALPATIRINKQLADKLGLATGDTALVKQNGNEVTLPVEVDDQIADGGVLIHAGLTESARLDSSLSPLTLTRA